MEELSDAISSGNYTKDDKIWLASSPNARDLIKKLLCVDPILRYTVE